MRRATVQAATLEAWRAHRAGVSPAEAGWLVACDAEDVDAAAQAIGAGAPLAPGGLRWLADRWSSADASPPGVRRPAVSDPETADDYDGGRAEQ